MHAPDLIEFRTANDEMDLAAAGADAQPLAVANYGELPTDVLHDILLRLRADEVCRLRLVCRSWRSLTSDPLFAAAHASRHPHVIVVSHHHESSDDEAEVRAVDLHGNVIKRMRIRLPAARRELARLSMHGDLLCVSHGWGRACVVDMVTGAVVADVVSEHPMRGANAVKKPQCVVGHVPSTGEYKLLCVQLDYSWSRWQTCEVLTLGGHGDAGGAGGRWWRRRAWPPVRLNMEPCSTSWSVAVVAGLAYFLVSPGPEDEPGVGVDSLAVFDLAAEEWKPATLQGPLSSRGGDDEPMPVFHRKQRRFKLSRLGESLVMLYCNVEGCSTELWFLEDDDDMAARWSRRYTLQRTAFEENDIFSSLQRYHYPLAVLNDGKTILVWLDRSPFAFPSALRLYDSETSEWTDLATPTPTGGRVVGMHRGSLLCSNLK